MTPNVYTDPGNPQEFRYMDAFLRNGMAFLEDLDNRGWVTAPYANAFVCDRDSERVGNSLNVYSPSNAYILATIFVLYAPLPSSIQKWTLVTDSPPSM